MEAILSFTPRLHLDGEPLSKKEIEQLLAQSEGLALIKNNGWPWTRTSSSRTLAAYQRAEELTAQGRAFLAGGHASATESGKLFGDADQTDGLVSVSHDVWLAELMQKLRDPATLNDIRPGKTFKARLPRLPAGGGELAGAAAPAAPGGLPGRRHGIGQNHSGPGAVECDLCEKAGKKDRRPPSLLVVPASLLANWMAEIQRFYPALSVFFAHPGMQSKADLQKGGSDLFADCDLVVTTYALPDAMNF